MSVVALSEDARRLNLVLDNFVERTPGVQEAVLVSSDGLAMSASRRIERDAADRFAAVASGLVALAYGAAGRFGGGAVNEIVIELERALIFVVGMRDGSCLAAVADARSEVGLVGYEMALLVERCAPLLTPALCSELQGALLLR